MPHLEFNFPATHMMREVLENIALGTGHVAFVFGQFPTHKSKRAQPGLPRWLPMNS